MKAVNDYLLQDLIVSIVFSVSIIGFDILELIWYLVKRRQWGFPNMIASLSKAFTVNSNFYRGVMLLHAESTPNPNYVEPAPAPAPAETTVAPTCDGTYCKYLL